MRGPVLTEDERRIIRNFDFLTFKPVIVVALSELHHAGGHNRGLATKPGRVPFRSGRRDRPSAT